MRDGRTAFADNVTDDLGIVVESDRRADHAAALHFAVNQRKIDLVNLSLEGVDGELVLSQQHQPGGVAVKVVVRPEDERQEKIRKYADAFELTKDLAQPVSSYSHGMKQKLAVISAWLHSPKLIVMDEPFVGLDPKAAFILKK